VKEAAACLVCGSLVFRGGGNVPHHLDFKTGLHLTAQAIKIGVREKGLSGYSSMKINFYATFRQVVGGKTIIIDLPQDSSVGQLVERLVTQYPALGPQLLDPNGQLFPHVHVFVNGRDAPYLPDAMQTVLQETDTVDIFPPVGGGSLPGAPIPEG
jgi:sulfur-carrier protein